MPSYNILIAGAGLGGIAAACCLMKAGHRVRVFEQAPKLGEVGAGIQISANAMHVLRDLGLESAIRKSGVQPEAYVFRIHDTGETLQRFSLAAEHEHTHGAPYTQMHRADFHEILAAKAREFDPDVVQLNKRVRGYTENENDVMLHFDDGTSATGDLLIGADGLKSAVRRQMLGDAVATYTGDAAWRITVPIHRIPQQHRLEKAMTLFLGPGGHSVCYYLRGGELINFVGCVETDDVAEESWTVKFPWERLKADYVGWHPAVQAIIEHCDKDQCYRWSMHARPPTRNWSTGRITLLGDSAHPTLPYLAQGAAMAIEDGAVLMRALAMAPNILDALQLYQRNRIDRTARIVEQSTANRALFHLRSVDEMRSAFARRNEGADRNKWLYSYNPLTVDLK